MDPATIITTMGAGLALVDQFRDLVLRWKKQPVTPVTGIARESAGGDAIEIDHAGVIESIPVEKMRLDEWDDVRYQALYSRVKVNWPLYNELFAQNVALSPDETARMNVRMELVRKDLCKDFREMVDIYQRVLQTHLPDHYELYETCPN
jgi:hypothetical protein